MTMTVDTAPAQRVPEPATRTLRVALYSHDAMGLGHIRRNLAIARTLSGVADAPDTLLLTSAPGAVVAEQPPGCDLVSLPGVEKGADGAYGARHLSIDARHLGAIRSAILRASLDAFRPDVLIVDKHACGLGGELEPALDLIASRGTRIVLGVRDVLDDPAVSAEEWDREGTAMALARWYDAVWVYGDRGVHDPLAGLPVPHRLRDRVVYTGYLAHGRTPDAPEVDVREPFVLATVGGGADGAHVARAFAEAPLPAGHTGLLVTGPQMPAADRRRIARIAAGRDDLVVREVVDGAAGLVARASAVVGMGGYNTVCEAMAARTPMLVVPRVTPRREQLIRARALADRGAVSVLEPRALTPGAVGAWLARAVCAPAPQPAGVDLDGLDRLPDLFRALAEAPAARKETLR